MEDREPRSTAGVVLDVAVVVVVLGFDALTWVVGSGTQGAWSLLLPAASAVALLWRRTRPAVTLAATGALAVLDTALADGGALLLPLAVAVCTAVSLGRRRLGLWAAGVSAVVLDGTLLIRGESPSSGIVAAVPLLLALASVVGLVVAARRAELAGAQERAARAEETRAAEARRAVAEERVRIARELHDVLAHQVAVVGVQAGVAETLLADDPDVARQALVTVRTASQNALRELATLLDLLRRGDPDDDDGADGGHRGAPAPSLDRLDDLLAAVRATGLQVEQVVEGEGRPLAPVVDLAAYRVVQEALTNAHKHGTGSARLVVGWRPAELEVAVANPVASAATDASMSTGYGLVGMHERVASVGGTLDAGRRGDEFVVHAVLPAARTSPTTHSLEEPTS